MAFWLFVFHVAHQFYFGYPLKGIPFFLEKLDFEMGGSNQ